MFSRTVTSIFFDGQFWIAEIERHGNGCVEVARHCFGPEPGNAELLDWVDRDLPRLTFHAREDQEGPDKLRRPNPKRMRRMAAAEMEKLGFSSKADAAMKSALEERKMSKRSERRARSEEERQARWTLHQEKLKARRRGR